MAETLGDYKLLRRIATGGMGEVYLAELRRSGAFRKAVALKTILPAYACKKDFAALFESEAAIAASLNHVNIVHVFDYGCAEGRTYMTQEFVEGPDMDGLLTACQDERLPLELVAEIAIQACRGLAHAHERRDLRGRPVGVVHGDVSPANFLLSMEGQVKLADFGLARLRDAAMGDGSISGKFSYMSPEQARGEALTPASDLFSLGSVLFELLSGQRAFPLRENPPDTLEDLRSAQHLKLSDLVPQLAMDWLELVDTCLAPSPADRPASARELAEAIQAVQTPCGPEGLARFLRERADALGQAGALAPDPTEVAQRPVTEEPPSPRRWKAALLFLFIICWGAGFTWIIINPQFVDVPPPPAKQSEPPASEREDTRPADKAPPPEEAKVVPPAVQPKPRPRPVVHAKPAPAPAPQARLLWPKDMRAWLNHKAVTGHEVALTDQRVQLIRLKAADGDGPEVTMRLQPPGEQAPFWRMTLRTRPWMRIRLDGKAAGQTPRTGLTLAHGRRHLELEREDHHLRLDFHLPPPKG